MKTSCKSGETIVRDGTMDAPSTVIRFACRHLAILRIPLVAVDA